MKEKILIYGGTRGLGEKLKALWESKGALVTALGKEHCDLTDGKALENQLKSTENFDTVVYCAGLSAAGKIIDVPVEAFRKCYEVNFFAPLTVLKHFSQNPSPPKSMVVILSGACEFLMPGLSAYALSKRALRDFVEYLKVEGNLKSKIYVVYPGGMDTGFDARTSIFGNYKLPQNLKLKDPALVAKKIIQSVEKGQGGLIGSPLLVRVIGFFQSLFPKTVTGLLRRLEA